MCAKGTREQHSAAYWKARAKAAEDLLYTDPMTGVYSRLGLFAYDRPVENRFITFLDIDGLKRVNDEYGHNTGDELIIDTAERLANTATRYGGIVARVGGDEFVMVTNRLPIIDPYIPVSHATHWMEDGETLDTCINTADQMMYVSKRARRKERV